MTIGTVKEFNAFALSVSGIQRFRFVSPSKKRPKLKRFRGLSFLKKNLNLELHFSLLIRMKNRPIAIFCLMRS